MVTHTRLFVCCVGLCLFVFCVDLSLAFPRDDDLCACVGGNHAHLFVWCFVSFVWVCGGRVFCPQEQVQWPRRWLNLVQKITSSTALSLLNFCLSVFLLQEWGLHHSGTVQSTSLWVRCCKTISFGRERESVCVCVCVCVCETVVWSMVPWLLKTVCVIVTPWDRIN